MSKAKDLRVESNKLQLKIQDLVNKFIEDNGICDIDIEVLNTYVETYDSDNTLIDTNVRVKVTV